MLTLQIPEGAVLAGKYRVERLLGRGGMGFVMSAWHLELDHRVALKFLHPELAERADAAERFRREARAAARIRSEHVARVIDVGAVGDSVPFMVMEYLDGHDLGEELEQRGTLPVSEAVEYMLEAIEAIAEAHAAGIVHRDLKPSNLFVCQRPDGARMIKVLDFGISKSLLTSSSEQMALTATSSLMGSPLYMSPEQMQSPRGVDARTDIWSLGAILYHALCGEPPYMGETIPQLCANLMNTIPAALTERRADVPVELDQIVQRCLEKDRNRRWQNVSELAGALAPFASAGAQLHVSRAARILSTPSGAAAVSRETPAAIAATLTSPVPRQRSEVTAVSEPSAEQPTGTHVAWGSTGTPSKSRTLLKALIAAAIALTGLVAFGLVVFRDSGRADAALDAKANEGNQAANVPALAAGTAAPASPSLPATSADVAPREPSVGPSQEDSGASSVSPAPAGAASSSATKQNPVSVSHPPAKPKKGAPAPPPKRGPEQAGSASGLTDFGGRR